MMSPTAATVMPSAAKDGQGERSSRDAASSAVNLAILGMALFRGCLSTTVVFV